MEKTVNPRLQKLKFRAVLTVVGIMILFVIGANIFSREEPARITNEVKTEMDNQLAGLVRETYGEKATVVETGEIELRSVPTVEKLRIKQIDEWMRLNNFSSSSKEAKALMKEKEQLQKKIDSTKDEKAHFRFVRIRKGDGEVIACYQRTDEDLRESKLTTMITDDSEIREAAKQSIEKLINE